LIKGCSKVLGCEWATRMRNSWNSENEFWKRGWILSSVLLSKRAILKTEIVSNNEIFHEMRFDKWYRSPMDYPVWMWIMICLGCSIMKGMSHQAIRKALFHGHWEQIRDIDDVFFSNDVSEGQNELVKNQNEIWMFFKKSWVRMTEWIGLSKLVVIFKRLWSWQDW